MKQLLIRYHRWRYRVWMIRFARADLHTYGEFIARACASYHRTRLAQLGHSLLPLPVVRIQAVR